MSVFDLFRGFFGVPGGHYRGDPGRDPFFDGLTHDDEDDEDDAYEEDGFRSDGHWGGDHGDSFDNAVRFGFSFGPGGMRIDEPPIFSNLLRGMEEIFSQFGHFEEQHGNGHYDIPRIMPPPSNEWRDRTGQRSSSGNSLRDSMLKSEEDLQQRARRLPRNEDPPSPTSPPSLPSLPSSPSHSWGHFSKFNDILKQGPKGLPEGSKEDRDLDSDVSSGGLDKIFTRPPSELPSQPGPRAYFKSVMVTKVVKPDGSMEERRTVRDGQGNEETTVTRSDARGTPEHPGNRDGPPGRAGGGQLSSDLRDDDSAFSRFFGGFR